MIMPVKGSRKKLAFNSSSQTFFHNLSSRGKKSSLSSSSESNLVIFMALLLPGTPYHSHAQRISSQNTVSKTEDVGIHIKDRPNDYSSNVYCSTQVYSIIKRDSWKAFLLNFDIVPLHWHAAKNPEKSYIWSNCDIFANLETPKIALSNLPFGTSLDVTIVGLIYVDYCRINPFCNEQDSVSLFNTLAVQHLKSTNTDTI